MTLKAAILLAPGAGATRDHSTLVALDEALTAGGYLVERMDFEYQRLGRRSPSKASRLIDEVAEAAAELRDAAGSVPVILGGRSMGGRICSMAAAGGVEADGLILISYPLHPPGRPESLRTDHFPSIHVPTLFISGTRDAFARPDELVAATKAIPSKVTHSWIDNGDHGLKNHDGELVRLVQAWL